MVGMMTCMCMDKDDAALAHCDLPSCRMWLQGKSCVKTECDVLPGSRVAYRSYVILLHSTLVKCPWLETQTGSLMAFSPNVSKGWQIGSLQML